MNFSADVSNVASLVCGDAISTGEIGLSGINTLTRTYVLLDTGAQRAARSVMQSVKNGSIKVVNDGGGVFTKSGMRVKGT